MKKYIIILLLPLVPTVILYKFFENIVKIGYAEHSLAINMTGSAAFYVILLWVSIKNINYFFDPLHRIRKDIVGKWRYKTIGHDENCGNGLAELTLDENNLSITGSLTLDKRNDPSSKRQYTWDATEIYLTNDKITWFFMFPGMQREGVARLNFHRDYNGIIHKMIGVWGVAGEDRGGSIEMTRI